MNYWEQCWTPIYSLYIEGVGQNVASKFVTLPLLHEERKFCKPGLVKVVSLLLEGISVAHLCPLVARFHHVFFIVACQCSGCVAYI